MCFGYRPILYANKCSIAKPAGATLLNPCLEVAMILRSTRATVVPKIARLSALSRAARWQEAGDSTCKVACRFHPKVLHEPHKPKPEALASAQSSKQSGRDDLGGLLVL